MEQGWICGFISTTIDLKMLASKCSVWKLMLLCILLIKQSGTCTGHINSKDTLQTSTVQSSCKSPVKDEHSIPDSCSQLVEDTHPYQIIVPQYRCIAIVTGFPDIKYHQPRIMRLLTQLSHDFHVTPDHVHIFCQGQCKSHFKAEFEYQFHELNNTIDRKLYRGFIITWNYKMMFQELFSDNYEHDHCLILEDDLVLAPDALSYTEAGVQLMKSDPSIFTVSLYNDNSYPWCSSNTSFFRRVDHFSGLGFVMSKRWYHKLVQLLWDENSIWDNILQHIVAEHHLVSIQPEVNRVLHTSNSAIKSISESHRPNDRFTAQVVSHLDTASYDLGWLHKESYDQYISGFIQSSIVIEYLEDAGFYDSSSQLVYINCCLDDLLRAHHLSGKGLGSMVRGIYQDTVFLRVYGVLTLLVQQNSPYFSQVELTHPHMNLNLTPNPNGDCSPLSVTFTSIVDLELLPRRLWGLMEHMNRHYKILQASVGISCATFCEKEGLPCTRVGLWLLNDNCRVLQYFIPDCLECQTDVNMTHWKDLQSKPTLDRNISHCTLGHMHFLNCHTIPAQDFIRICPCKKIP